MYFFFFPCVGLLCLHVYFLGMFFISFFFFLFLKNDLIVVQGCPTKIILVFFLLLHGKSILFYFVDFSLAHLFFHWFQVQVYFNFYFYFKLLWMTMKFGLFCHFFCVATIFLSNWTHTFYLASWKLSCKYQCWSCIYFWLGISQGINQCIGCLDCWA
jgi:hypothetical protein